MVYVVMKRMYYDSVKDHLNCAKGVNLDEDGHPKDKLLTEILNISYIDYTDRSVVLNSNYSDLSHSDLIGLTNNNESISIKASCSCVYLNATDINRFVISIYLQLKFKRKEKI